MTIDITLACLGAIVGSLCGVILLLERRISKLEAEKEALRREIHALKEHITLMHETIKVIKKHL